MRMRLACIVLLILFGEPLVAEERMRSIQVTLKAAVSGDTIELASGDILVLVGIEAPKMPGFGLTPQPMAKQATAYLNAVAEGEEAFVYFVGEERDRHRRLLGQIELKDGTWLQGLMVRRGMARVHSLRSHTRCIRELQKLEQVARTERLGIWSLDWYQVRSPDRLRQEIDTFQIVEGRVRAAAIVKGRHYLNFGDDWKTDFTVTIAPKFRKALEGGDIDLKSLEGQRIRVRGWITSYNGPNLEVTHPEQIEYPPNQRVKKGHRDEPTLCFKE